MFVYVPAPGLKAGVTTLKVYTAVAISESFQLSIYAIAFNVVDADILTGSLYSVPVKDVGVLPSVVYLIAAPGVVVEIVTLWALEYVPPPGVKVGVDTVPVILIV